ncbi:MAG: alpha-1,4-glucan--maltose-1-phosphate maltosyltransferase [Opitutales bacterium]|nr:alpha-1,4-glucan--maltose-1-phosphate maltosyltransferase [Opitutales bacterium]
MSLTTDIDLYGGQSRVIIDRIMPSIDGGLFPVKRVEGEAVHIEAHVFADGHDTVVAALQYRHRGEEPWQEIPFTELPNDEWEAFYTPTGIGLHEFRVVGWVDHFRFWFEGYGKKLHEGQNMAVELQIGAKLVNEAADRASGADAYRLRQLAAELSNETAEIGWRSGIAQSAELYRLATRYPDRSRATYSEPMPLLVERERALFSSWYEFFPRSWGNTPGKHGTFREAMRILPEIKEMGFNVVYLPPINPVGRKFRKGRNNALEAAPDDPGSPWAIGSAEGGHKSVNPELGTLEDFHAFVARVNELGMEIAIDIAFQCAPDHPYIKEHPDWFVWRPDGTIQYAENPPKKYQDIVPFNFENPDWKGLWTELKSVFEFWLEQGVKIFRVDNPHTKNLEFWHWCLTSMKAEHPETLYLAEAFTRPKRMYRLAKGCFTQSYTYFTWRNARDEIREYVEELTKSEVSEFFWPNFWPNTPDILHEYIQLGKRNGSIARMILAGTLSSNWGIYGPAFELYEHEPFPGKEEYNHNEKYEIKSWDWDRPGNLKKLIARFNYIRNTNPALQRTKNVVFADTDNSNLIAYVKKTPDLSNIVLTVVNLDYNWTQSGWLELPLWQMGIGDHESFRVTDLFSQDKPDGTGLESFVWTGRRNFVSLRPGSKQAHVFLIEKLK